MKHDKRILTAILILTIASWSTVRVMAATSHPAPPHHWTGKMLTLPQRMRGVNVESEAVDPALVKRLAKWHCNTMRINFSIDLLHNPKKLTPPSPDHPLAPYRKNLKKLDAILPICQKLDIRVILSAAKLYWRPLHGKGNIWSKKDRPKLLKELTAFWKAFATRYKGAPAIVAYDVFNEPMFKGFSRKVWFTKARPQAIAAIRSVNPNIWLIVEGGIDSKHPKYNRLVHTHHVIYSFHMYAPHTYTMQGIGANRGMRGKVVYPGMIRRFHNNKPKTYWDKAHLVKYMMPAIQFAKNNHVRILIGEFGVLRWAPNKAQWISDCISIFEKHHFDWLYHSPVGWNGFNPTFARDAPSKWVAGKNSDGGYRGKAMAVLLKGWAKNEQEIK